MNQSDAQDLVRAVMAQDGRPSMEWDVEPIGDLGWACSPVGVRSNVAYAVTPNGRIGSYVLSVTRDEDALRMLAALPEPRSGSLVTDQAQAQALLEEAVRPLGDLGQTGWRQTEIPDLGWLFIPIGTNRELSFVVTRTGQVSVCPTDDPTGAATARELTQRARRIPVAQLSP